MQIKSKSSVLLSNTNNNNNNKNIYNLIETKKLIMFNELLIINEIYNDINKYQTTKTTIDKTTKIISCNDEYMHFDKNLENNNDNDWFYTKSSKVLIKTDCVPKQKWQKLCLIGKIQKSNNDTKRIELSNNKNIFNQTEEEQQEYVGTIINHSHIDHRTSSCCNISKDIISVNETNVQQQNNEQRKNILHHCCPCKINNSFDYHSYHQYSCRNCNHLYYCKRRRRNMTKWLLHQKIIHNEDNNNSNKNNDGDNDIIKSNLKKNSIIFTKTQMTDTIDEFIGTTNSSTNYRFINHKFVAEKIPYCLTCRQHGHSSTGKVEENIHDNNSILTINDKNLYQMLCSECTNHIANLPLPLITKYCAKNHMENSYQRRRYYDNKRKKHYLKTIPSSSISLISSKSSLSLSGKELLSQTTISSPITKLTSLSSSSLNHQIKSEHPSATKTVIKNNLNHVNIKNNQHSQIIMNECNKTISRVNNNNNNQVIKNNRNFSSRSNSSINISDSNSFNKSSATTIMTQKHLENFQENHHRRSNNSLQTQQSICFLLSMLVRLVQCIILFLNKSLISFLLTVTNYQRKIKNNMNKNVNNNNNWNKMTNENHHNNNIKSILILMNGRKRRTFTQKLTLFLVWLTLITFLVNFTITLLVAGANANELSGPRLRNFSKVCTSMDIRNSPKAFENLANCSVIEGFLVISLIDKYSEQDYENLSFPLLTEVTDYLMIYRVNGLKTLGKLFPNLSVIRGNILFEGYALVIYENNNLQEIDLKSLTTIKRGAIRIEKNPLLCFVETINWNKIAVNTSQDSHFFRDNKIQNECPSCPTGEEEDNGPKCPLYSGGKRYCWNRKNCQKICPDRCKNTCNDKGECCHEFCLGGCDNSDVQLCSVCRHLSFGLKCVSTCPDKFYKFLERSCISADECFSKKPSLNPDFRHEHPYVIYSGVCTTRCPNNYEKVNNQTCEPCKNGKCLRKCEGAQIDSISDAIRLRGCTIIKGSLIISIRQTGRHLMEELENALLSIEEIHGFLKVSRSFPLLSLSFLKNLRVIKGKDLESGKYALYVLDNQNLQNIWRDNQTVIIENGRIFFHFNPKLCYYKIENLLSMMVNNASLDKSEVATDSNGDRGLCNITILNVNVTKVAARAAIVAIEPMEFEDDRGFIGYQYHYIEAPHKNVSIYDSRQGCGTDGWNVDEDNSKATHHIFTHLKPFRQYAFYVKTYTITSEHRNGQSNITYFQTLPDKPEMVRNLRFQVLSSSEVMIRWRPPKEANGNLTTYVIKANLTHDDPKLLDERNYCTEPIKPIYDVPPVLPPSTSEKDIRPTSKDECLCDNGEKGGSKITNKDEDDIIENAIDFEDKLQNFIYIKHERTESGSGAKNVRRKREDKFPTHFLSSSSSSIPPLTMPVSSSSSATSSSSTDTSTDSGDKLFPQQSDPQAIGTTNESDSKEVTKPRMKGNYYTYFYKPVSTSTHEFILTKLKHYSTYTISVKACREGSPNEDRCSFEAIAVVRTQKLVGADDVKNWSAEVENTNNSRSFVRLRWDPPPNPNSMIVSYSIKFKRADIEHAKYLDKCITQREYQNLTGGGYVVSNLDPGNYSLQLMATSLAGDGNFTEPKYFIIPESRLGWPIITAIVLAPISFIVLLIILFWYVRKKYLLQQPNNMKLITTVNPEYVSMQYTPDEWELPRDKIVQLRELGQGSFGMVYEGLVKNYGKNDEDVPCAIKTVNESATDRERANFLKEASVMKDFDTHHVVRLLGVVSRGQPTLVIMELMINGDLKGYLRQHRPDAENVEDGEPPPQPPTLRRILQMAIEIADGMAYLSAKKYVHRDLAARNCMVAGDLTVKIGDFGMTRDIYETDYYRKGTKGLLPVRWMAPESLKDGVFTSSSDVFSYGVVLWEMATLASQPYQGLSNDQVLRYVIDGGVMERPENCPDKLYNLMQKCWQHRPSNRPSFLEIIQYLLDDADPRFRTVSFYYSAQAQELLAQMNAATDMDDVTTPLRVGDDDFKMDVDDNFLLNRADSHHLTQEVEQPHSPYSYGFDVKICSTPGDISHPQQQQSQQRLRFSQHHSPTTVRMSDLTVAAAGATGNQLAIGTVTEVPEPVVVTESQTVAAEVQNLSTNNTTVQQFPRLKGVEFLRNAFFKGGNSSSGSNSNSIPSRDVTGGPDQQQQHHRQRHHRRGSSLERQIEEGRNGIDNISSSGIGAKNTTTTIGSGAKNFFLTAFSRLGGGSGSSSTISVNSGNNRRGQNGEVTETRQHKINELNSNERRTSKDYQKLNESAASTVPVSMVSNQSTVSTGIDETTLEDNEDELQEEVQRLNYDEQELPNDTENNRKRNHRHRDIEEKRTKSVMSNINPFRGKNFREFTLPSLPKFKRSSQQQQQQRKDYNDADDTEHRRNNGSTDTFEQQSVTLTEQPKQQQQQQPQTSDYLPLTPLVEQQQQPINGFITQRRPDETISTSRSVIESTSSPLNRHSPQNQSNQKLLSSADKRPQIMQQSQQQQQQNQRKF